MYNIVSFFAWRCFMEKNEMVKMEDEIIVFDERKKEEVRKELDWLNNLHCNKSILIQCLSMICS